MPNQAELYRFLVAKVRTAVDEIEALMLSDAWDTIPPERQQALAKVARQMRVELAPSEGALGEPFSDEDENAPPFTVARPLGKGRQPARTSPPQSGANRALTSADGSSE